MIQDLTFDEIVWRYDMLNDLIEDNLEKIQENFSSEERDMELLRQFIGASLIYLQLKGCITITLHKGQTRGCAIYSHSSTM